MGCIWWSHWHRKRRPISETRKLKLKWHLRRLSAPVTPFQLQGIGMIQIKEVGDIGLAFGYADILNKITALTVRDRKWDSRWTRVGKCDMDFKRHIDIVWEWVGCDSHTGMESDDPWVNFKLESLKFEMTPTTVERSCHSFSTPVYRFDSDQECWWRRAGYWLCWHPW
jgi:hypothetical protein